MFCLKTPYPLLLFVLLQTNLYSFSQNADYPLNDWVEKLSAHNGPVLSGALNVFNELKRKDSSTAINVLNELETRGSKKDGYFKSRFFLTKALWLWSMKRSPLPQQFEQLMKQALN